MDTIRKSQIFIVVLLGFTTLFAQSEQKISLIINDSVKTVNLNNNIDFNRKLNCSIFNRKIRFSVTLVNNMNKPQFFYLISKRVERYSEKYNLDSVLYHNLNSSNIPNEYSSLDIKSAISPGFSYVIETKNGCIESRVKWDKSIVPEHKFQKLSVKHERQEEKKYNRMTKNIKNSLNRIQIYEESQQTIYIDYRRLLRPANSLYYMTLSPGEYRITFYYIFYYTTQDIYKIFNTGEAKTYSELVNLDIEQNSFDREQVFEGYIKSNTVKLIVK